MLSKSQSSFMALSEFCFNRPANYFDTGYLEYGHLQGELLIITLEDERK